MKLTVLLLLIIVAGIFAFGFAYDYGLTGNAVSLTDPAKAGFSYAFRGMDSSSTSASSSASSSSALISIPDSTQLCEQTLGVSDATGCVCPDGSKWTKDEGCVFTQTMSNADSATSFASCAMTGGVWTPTSDVKGMGIGSRDNRGIAILNGLNNYCDCPAPFDWEITKGCVKSSYSKDHQEIMCVLTDGKWTVADLTRLPSSKLSKTRTVMLTQGTKNGFCVCTEGSIWGDQFKNGCSKTSNMVDCSLAENIGDPICLARVLGADLRTPWDTENPNKGCCPENQLWDPKSPNKMRCSTPDMEEIQKKEREEAKLEKLQAVANKCLETRGSWKPNHCTCDSTSHWAGPSEGCSTVVGIRVISFREECEKTGGKWGTKGGCACPDGTSFNQEDLGCTEYIGLDVYPGTSAAPSLDFKQICADTGGSWADKGCNCASDFFDTAVGTSGAAATLSRTGGGTKRGTAQTQEVPGATIKVNGKDVVQSGSRYVGGTTGGGVTQ